MAKAPELLSSCFSMPYGPAQTYGAPPYAYRKARSISVVYTIDGSGLAPYLPPGVELADAEPVVSAAFGAYPESTAFGRYQEMWFYVRTVFRGRRFMFNPLMYVTSDMSMACGREMWGYPKKMAALTMSYGDGTWRFEVERPVGERLLDLTFSAERRGEPTIASEIAYPSLTFRMIPNRLGRGEPDIAQLIATSNPKEICVDADGLEDRWLGRADMVFGHGTAQDPFHLFKPKKILEAWTSTWNADLPEGELVHDYKLDGS